MFSSAFLTATMALRIADLPSSSCCGVSLGGFFSSSAALSSSSTTNLAALSRASSRICCCCWVRAISGARCYRRRDGPQDLGHELRRGEIVGPLEHVLKHLFHRLLGPIAPVAADGQVDPDAIIGLVAGADL